MQPVSASPRTVLHLKFRIVKKKNNNKTKYRQYKNLHSCPGGVRFVRAEVKSENEKNNVKAWASSRWAFDTHIIILSLRLFFLPMTRLTRDLVLPTSGHPFRTAVPSSVGPRCCCCGTLILLLTSS